MEEWYKLGVNADPALVNWHNVVGATDRPPPWADNLCLAELFLQGGQLACLVELFLQGVCLRLSVAASDWRPL